MESLDNSNQDSCIFWGKSLACPDQKPDRNRTMLVHCTTASPVWWLGRQHEEPARSVHAISRFWSHIVITSAQRLSLRRVYWRLVCCIRELQELWTFRLSTCLMPLAGPGWLGRFRLASKVISCDFAIAVNVHKTLKGNTYTIFRTIDDE